MPGVQHRGRYEDVDDDEEDPYWFLHRRQQSSTKIFQHASKNHVGPTFYHVEKVGTSSSPGGECLNLGNSPRIPPAAAAKIAPETIAQNCSGCRNTKPLAICPSGGTVAEIHWKSLTGKYGGSHVVTMGTPHRQLSAYIDRFVNSLNMADCNALWEGRDTNKAFSQARNLI